MCAPQSHTVSGPPPHGFLFPDCSLGPSRWRHAPTYLAAGRDGGHGTSLSVAHDISQLLGAPGSRIVHVRDRAFNDRRWEGLPRPLEGHVLWGVSQVRWVPMGALVDMIMRCHAAGAWLPALSCVASISCTSSSPPGRTSVTPGVAVGNPHHALQQLLHLPLFDGHARRGRPDFSFVGRKRCPSTGAAADS